MSRARWLDEQNKKNGAKEADSQSYGFVRLEVSVGRFRSNNQARTPPPIKQPNSIVIEIPKDIPRSREGTSTIRIKYEPPTVAATPKERNVTRASPGGIAAATFP
jgi:hypothetical protein